LQNKERRVKRKSLFELEQRYKDNIAYELQSKNNIGCYDKVMESYPNYPVIIYTYILKYKQMLKILISTKMKSLRNINNRLMMIFIILL
jgi:hypothetical protein